MRRRVAVAVAAAVIALPAAPVFALTEARIVDVSCSGLRVVQTGLPSGPFEVKVVDPATRARVLATADVAVGRDGRLDRRIPVSLKGLRRVVVEVESVAAEEEYGEAGADLHLPCSPRWAPVAAPAKVGTGTTGSTNGGSGQGATVARSSAAHDSHSRSGWLVAVGAALLAAAAAAALGVRFGRRDPGRG